MLQHLAQGLAPTNFHYLCGWRFLRTSGPQLQGLTTITLIFFPYIQSEFLQLLAIMHLLHTPIPVWLLHNPSLNSWEQPFSPISVLVFRINKSIFLSVPLVFNCSSPLNCPQDWPFAGLCLVFNVFLVQWIPKLDTEHTQCHKCWAEGNNNFHWHVARIWLMQSSI